MQHRGLLCGKSSGFRLWWRCVLELGNRLFRGGHCSTAFALRDCSTATTLLYAGLYPVFGADHRVHFRTNRVWRAATARSTWKLPINLDGSCDLRCGFVVQDTPRKGSQGLANEAPPDGLTAMPGDNFGAC